jgi:hypothetical protein
LTQPNEREFVVFRRGELREGQLIFLRNGLRALPNPKTGLDFTEDEVRRSTTAGSRFYVEADAIDIICQGNQKRDEFFAQQARVDRAGTEFLRNYHAPQWGEEYLPSTGGSGSVVALGNPGTTWIGSTTIPDPFASFALDEASNRYQVLVNGTADADGEAELLLVGIDGGDATNIAVGTVLTWSNPPPGSKPKATVTGDDFTGGGPEETDAEFSSRLAARIRRKPGAGNESQIRDIARAASNAIEDAFVYPCALNAGSTLVALTQKRRDATGPTARTPSAGALAAASAALVPPGSAQIPARAFFAVLAWSSQPSDCVVHLSQRRRSAAGWQDVQPFPLARAAGAAVAISVVTNQANFRIVTDAALELPNGVAGPLAGIHLMIWDVPSSRFESLNVDTIEDLGAGVYRVLLLSPPAHTLTVGDWISPDMARRVTLAESAESYFDALGPGELIDLDTSSLAVRAFRRPSPDEERPYRAGSTLLTFLREGLGASLSDSQLAAISETVPDVPVDPIDGPNMLTLGKFAVYDLA